MTAYWLKGRGPAVKRALFFWALNLGLGFEFGGKNGTWYESQLSLARKLVFSKWREALGGNVKAIVMGLPPSTPPRPRFLGGRYSGTRRYGLTETSPVIAVNNFEPDGAAIGTVGPVIFTRSQGSRKMARYCVKAPTSCSAITIARSDRGSDRCRRLVPYRRYRHDAGRKAPQDHRSQERDLQDFRESTSPQALEKSSRNRSSSSRSWSSARTGISLRADRSGICSPSEMVRVARDSLDRPTWPP